MIPAWLHVLSIFALLLGLVCALALAVDVTRHPQHMGIMNVVWPMTGLYAGPLALWGYFRFGRATGHGHGAPAKPLYAAVGIGDTHCGAGCTLGDIIAEWLCFGIPAIAVRFGWHWLFAEKMFAVWIVDFVFAFAFGIVFQYFAIAPMRGLSFWPGIRAALKADTLSLTAWQIGMYGFMAVAQYAYFRPLLGRPVEVNTPEFWFTMQIAMLAGFATGYPVNWWLIGAGIKEKM
jgi:Domain of unknown function (DUF4396)